VKTAAVFDRPTKVETASIGTLRPNAFGLHDVHGNVWSGVAIGMRHMTMPCARATVFAIRASIRIHVCFAAAVSAMTLGRALRDSQPRPARVP